MKFKRKIGSSLVLIALGGIASTAMAAMSYQGIGGWRTSDGRGGWVQNDNAENSFDIGINACKQACETNDRCRGIEYFSDPNGWEEEGQFVHNKCEIHRDPYAHCDQSVGGRGSADDGCWIKHPEVIWGGPDIDVITTISHTKLDNLGNALEPNPTNWRCVQDNRTGLVWEVKSSDAGHSQYSEHSYALDAVPAYVAAINDDRLCGRTNWRLPTLVELESIVDYTSRAPAISTYWFGPTATWFHWTSSRVWTAPTESQTYNGYTYQAQVNFNRDFVAGVGFMDGHSGATPKTSIGNKAIRLVSDGR